MLGNKLFVKTLKKEIKSWIKSDIVSANDAQKILNYYEQDSYKNSYFYFSIIGSFLIGIGLLSLVAHNWDQMSKTIRFSIAILPLLVAQALGFYILKYKVKSKVWIEGVGIFWFLSAGVAIAIVGQTYHIASSFRDFYLLWFLLLYPILFLLKSDGVAFLILVIINMLFSQTFHNNVDKAIFLILLFLWIVYYLYRYKVFKHSISFAILSYALVFTCIVNFLFFLNSWFYDYMFLFLLFYYIDFIFFDDISSFKRAFGVLGKFGLSIVSLSLLIKGITFEVFDNLILFTICFMLSFIGFLYILNKKRVDDIFYPLFPILASIVLYFPSFLWVYNILFVAILAFMIYSYSLKKEVIKANYVFTLLCVGVFVKFISNDFGFIAQGIAFIILGFCFLYMNLFIRKMAKR